MSLPEYISLLDPPFSQESEGEEAGPGGGWCARRRAATEELGNVNHVGLGV